MGELASKEQIRLSEILDKKINNSMTEDDKKYLATLLSSPIPAGMASLSDTCSLPGFDPVCAAGTMSGKQDFIDKYVQSCVASYDPNPMNMNFAQLIKHCNACASDDPDNIKMCNALITESGRTQLVQAIKNKPTKLPTVVNDTKVVPTPAPPVVNPLPAQPPVPTPVPTQVPVPTPVTTVEDNTVKIGGKTFNKGYFIIFVCFIILVILVAMKHKDKIPFMNA